MRSDFKNDGRRFEELFQRVADIYRQRGLLRLEKADPPTRIVGVRPNVRIIYLENPWSDFTGAWTERGGRHLAIEVKSTKDDLLRIGPNITDKQIDWLLRWHSAGAAAGVVWESGFKVAFLPLGTIQEIRRSGRRHVKFAEADPVPQGIGLILFDFIVNLRRWYPA